MVGCKFSIVLLGASFKTSSIDFREGLASKLQDESRRRSIASLPGVRETAVLVTCNRVEIVASVESSFKLSRLLRILGLSKRDVDEGRVFFLRDIEAVRHFVAVTSGLDSVVVGEYQITEQVNRIGKKERASGNVKAILSRLFDASVSRGREIRYILEGEVNSMSVLAVKAAKMMLGRIPREALLIGSSKTAIIAVKGLQEYGTKVHVVSGRVPGRIPTGVEVHGYEDIGRVAGACDAIIAATNREGYVLKREHVDSGNRVVVDLGFPRNVDPEVGKVPGIRLLNLDDLSKFASSLPVRKDRIVEAENRVSVEAEELMAQIVATRSSGAIPTIYRWAEKLRAEETDRALRRLQGISQRQRRVVEAMSRRLVSKLLSGPTEYVRSSRQGEQSERLSKVAEVFLLD